MRPHWKWERAPDGDTVRASTRTFQVSFVSEVPALGMAVYFVVNDPDDEAHLASKAELSVHTSCKGRPSRGVTSVADAITSVADWCWAR